VTEGHYFDPELRLRAEASGGQAEEESDDGVEGGEDHGPDHRPGPGLTEAGGRGKPLSPLPFPAGRIVERDRLSR